MEPASGASIWAVSDLEGPLKNLRQGKFFEIEINENDENKAQNKIEEMCNKLLVNLIIEDFKISKI